MSAFPEQTKAGLYIVAYARGDLALLISLGIKNVSSVPQRDLMRGVTLRGACQ